MTEIISSVSIAGMVFTFAISIGVPIAAVIYGRKKLGGSLTPVVVGIGAFFLFAMVLEQILHRIVYAAFGNVLVQNLWLYALYGGLAAGVFEETGRYLAMKRVMKDTLSKENSVMYGIGHGGAESIILIGMTYLSNLVTAFLINQNGVDSLLESVDESMRAQVREQLSGLWTTPSYQFALAGVERMAAFVLQLCLSYIVYRAVKEAKPVYYLLAVLVHFLVDGCLVMLSSMIPILAAELILILVVGAIAFVTVKKYREEAGQSGTSLS